MGSLADFNCAICLDTASEPVVTRCGHLFCWDCLDHWLRSKRGSLTCPVCKGRVDESLPGDIIPLYGKGKKTSDDDPRPEPEPIPAPTTLQTGTTATGNAVADGGAGTATGGEAATASAPVRDTSYHFNYVRREPATNGNSNRTNSSGSSTAASAAHHPRPAAPRAPTPPRARPRGTHARAAADNIWRTSPLSIGGSFVFLGGSMQLTILFFLFWAAYNFLPWQEARDQLERRVQQARQRGLRAFFDRPPTPSTNASASANQRNDDGAAEAAAAANGSQSAAGGGTSAAAAAPLAMQDVARYVVLGLALFVLLSNLLIIL